MTENKLYQPNWQDIMTHRLPEWYDNCKLGIFVHWGLYSVPAWSEVTWELGAEPSDVEWFTHNPYAEWYLNTLRIPNSPVQKRHYEVYGKDYPYERFTEGFTCEKWDPDAWAALFKEAGAGYVVLTTKHHDGFCLYPSAYTDYNSMRLGPKRDLMGDLTQAVRAKGLRMGAYYSGLFDWTTYPYPKTRHGGGEYDNTFAFADYSYRQATEVVDMYKPSVLWNDIGWPRKGIEDLPYLFAHYYNNVEGGLINDRWSCPWYDYSTAEYLHGTRSLDKKWEMCRGLGLSFGYNQTEGPDTVLSGHALVRLLVEYVSHNGNLLINVGPRADGTIPEIQAERLQALGSWLKRHGDAIYETRIWKDRQHDKLENGADAYYTRKGRDLYAIIAGLHTGWHNITLPIAEGSFPVEVRDEYPVHLYLPGYFG